MTPPQFERLLADVGFRLTSLICYPPAPRRCEALWYALRKAAKRGLRGLENRARLPYEPSFYIVENP